MLRRLLVTLVGMAMGGLIGLGATMVGWGRIPIVVGAVLGGAVFFIGIPRT
ncbi:MAG TPA: hypothetical protein VMI94_04010 [Bryobacteraceae bacterium]|nr:hypothetical protein [Bryobacteraceae bacterium]